ncbi:MAG TPA: S53 family peptidase, partial [Gaiellaceae bacterium]|nr:S53 family peptidase [Gaiellaceae bacterium]
IAGSARVAPLKTSSCIAVIGIRCYSPGQFERAYNLAGLHAAGINGAGQTIAIVDSFGSPTIASDLHAFDQAFANPPAGSGIPPDPAIAADPQLTIIQPAGAVPPFDPTNSDMVGWAQETTLDVEWAHVLAPKAKILLVETPVSETEGVTGFPEIVKAENFVIDHHLASVISQSFGATEETFPNPQAIFDLRSAFKNAQRHNVTVLAASGDEGSTDFELNLSDLYPMQVNSWPSSDPLVTSVGGTQMNLDDQGNHLSPDVVWNDSPIGIQAAGGGGPSHVFDRPDFQDRVKSVVGHARGTPDISMNAAVDGGVWVYYTFVNPTSPYHIFGGTSAATPEFAGVVAMASQLAGQPLGLLNEALYRMHDHSGIVDVTQGNNDIGPFVNSDGNTYHVPGYTAAPGYDLASGLGTLDAGSFVPALARAAGEGGDQGQQH